MSSPRRGVTVNRRVAEHGVDEVGAQAGGVDYPACRDWPPAGVHRGGITTGVDAVDTVAGQQGDAAVDGVGGQREVDRPGADDRLVGHGHTAERPWPEVRQLRVDGLGVDEFAAVIAVGFGLVFQRRQGVELFLVPGDQDGAGVLDRDAGVGGVFGEQVIAAADHGRFQRAGLGVETGVQDGGVGLAGAVADVVAGFEQRDRQLVAGQFSSDGGADDAGADDDDVVAGRSGHEDSCLGYVVAARSRHCWRNSSARAVVQLGS